MILFIDDERDPGKGWGSLPVTVVRSYDEAIEYFENNGCPWIVSFDHDLGEEKTGFDIAKWMIERDLDLGGSFFDANFEFDVHSQNPIGAKNIRELLRTYLDYTNPFY